MDCSISPGGVFKKIDKYSVCRDRNANHDSLCPSKYRDKPCSVKLFFFIKQVLK